MNYLLLFLFLVLICALIFEKRKPEPKLFIKRCCFCGFEAHLTGDFFDSQVKCSNVNCRFTGPKAQTEKEAADKWNKITTRGE